MKNLKNALGVSMLLVLIILFVVTFESCSKSSVGGPVDPHPSPALPKINSFIPATSTVSVHYNGLSDPSRITFAWNTANGLTTFDGASVNAVDSKIINAGYENKQYILRVTPTTGNPIQESRDLVVTIDPILLKICAPGIYWKIISSTKQAPGGPPINILSTCRADDKLRFFPNCRYEVDQGTSTSCFMGLDTSSYTFNPVMMILQVEPSDLQPARKVTFPAPNQMRCEYDKSGYNWVEVYQQF